MSDGVFMSEVEFGLSFSEPWFMVPFEAQDPEARIELAQAKIVADASGQKQTVGSLYVRDRKREGEWKPLPMRAYVVHRLGPMVDIPSVAGRLVGSFSSHQGRHHWHVFAPKESRGPSTRPIERVASPSPIATGTQTSHASPERAL